MESRVAVKSGRESENRSGNGCCFGVTIVWPKVVGREER